MTNESKQNTALLLGYTGTAPLVACAIYVAWFALSGQHFAAHVAFVGLAYGAVILSFVGALHWAHALHRPELGAGSLVRSVIPALVAWISLCIALLVPGGFGVHAFAAALLIASFLEHLRADYALHRTHNEKIVPAWFLRLRLHLTAVVCVSLGVIAACALAVR
jgi:hypothetical protein